MWKLLDPKGRRRNFADEWLGRSAHRTWLVQCVLSRREPFGTVTVTTTSCHRAVDEDEAKLLGMQAAAGSRSGYRLDLVTATLVEPP